MPSSASFTLKDSSGNTVAGTHVVQQHRHGRHLHPVERAGRGDHLHRRRSAARQTIRPDDDDLHVHVHHEQGVRLGGQCPCAIWPDVAPSGATDATDTTAVNLGVQFQATQNGTISGIRFYKEPDNTGTHTGTLWTASGTQLATGTFTNESTQGWEELDFSTPVSVTAGTTYVASYHTTTGHYAATSGGLSSAVTNGPLTALANGGVYAYGSSTHLPDEHVTTGRTTGSTWCTSSRRHRAVGDVRDAGCGFVEQSGVDRPVGHVLLRRWCRARRRSP